MVTSLASAISADDVDEFAASLDESDDVTLPLDGSSDLLNSLSDGNRSQAGESCNHQADAAGTMKTCGVLML